MALSPRVLCGKSSAWLVLSRLILAHDANNMPIATGKGRAVREPPLHALRIWPRFNSKKHVNHENLRHLRYYLLKQNRLERVKSKTSHLARLESVHLPDVIKHVIDYTTLTSARHDACQRLSVIQISRTIMRER